MPLSSFNNAIGYYPFTMSAGLSPNARFVENYVIQIGAAPVSTSDFLWGAGFTAPQARSIDQKIDDGVMAGGKFQSVSAGYASSINTNTSCTNVDSDSTGCISYFVPDVP